MLTAAQDKDGYVSLQDLVDIKLWIAEQEGLSEGPSTISQIETNIAFIRAGGNYTDTLLVNMQDVLNFILQGQRPTVNDDNVVNSDNTAALFDVVDWN